MKFKQKIQKTVPLRFSADRNKKCCSHSNEKTEQKFINLRTDDFSHKIETGEHFDAFQKGLNNEPEENVRNKGKGRSTSDTIVKTDNDQLDNTSNLPEKNLHETQKLPSSMVSFELSSYFNKEGIKVSRTKKNVFKRPFSKSKRKTGFVTKVSSSKLMTRPKEKQLSSNLRSYILSNFNDISEFSRCSIGHISSLEKIQKKENEKNISKKLSLHSELTFEKSKSLVPKTEDEKLDSDSLSFRVSNDIPPTCADIYGVDEVDNVSFEKLITERELVSELGPKAETSGQEMDFFAESVKGIKPDKIVNFSAQNSTESKSLDKGKDEMEKRENVNDTYTDKCGEIKSTNTVCKRNQTSVSEHEKSLTRIPSLRRRSSQLEASSSKEHEQYENPWILQHSIHRCSQTFLPETNIEVESSLGFEVNCSADSKVEEILHTPLTRSDSTDTVDSFGSSYHSVSSMKDLYFSDSEAEHNVDKVADELEDDEREQRNSKILVDLSKETVENVLRNDVISKISNATDKTSVETKRKEGSTDDICQKMELVMKNVKRLSDSDSDEKQLIPYALAENFSGNDTVRKKKKKLHSRSFDEKLDTSFTETPEKVTGEKKNKLLKSLSHGLPSESEAKHEEKTKHFRRSLDSSLTHRNILNELQSPEKRRSFVNSSNEFLSPVLESEMKVAKTDKADDRLDKNLDHTRFFTLPNPKKLKAQQSNIRKRLGSVSKLISDKAQSFSNLKMGASFKLRKEFEKSKVLVSSSATSLSDLMSKKASSFSTLIRRRSNSNTAVESPFKQYTRKVHKIKEENKMELVYEKVRVKVPAKRPVTGLEQTARSKRLRVSLRLAKNASKSESEKYEDETGSGANSYTGMSWGSGSLSPIRSPTLLDEIMKCVDTARVRQHCSVLNDDGDLSDCEESSSGSSLFWKQYSLESDSKETTFRVVCGACGKIRNTSDRSSGSSDSLNLRKSSGSHRFSLSLCDLNATCQCFKRDSACKRRLYGIIPSTDANAQKSFLSDKRRSWDVISDFKETETDEIKTGNISSNGKLIFNSNQRPSSMFDLRQTLDETDGRVEFEMGETESRDSIGSSDALPGTLLRHRPLLDLSGEHLDDTVESEEGVIDSKGDSYTLRSQSCGDLIDSGRYFENGITRDDVLKMKVKNDKEEDSESFHSCSETAETETDVNDLEYETENVKQKCNSCSNLLDEEEVSVGDKLKQEEQRKRELRKVKVKSMSSSHDALSLLVPMEIINIDDFEIPKAINQENYDIQYSSQGNENGQSLVNNIIELTQNGVNIENEISKQKQPDVISGANKTKTNLEQFSENNEDDKENLICEKCKCLRKSGNESKFMKDADIKIKRTGNEERKVLSKPPLPRNRQRTKVLSLSDISNQGNKDDQLFRKQRGFSMIELDKENMNINLCECSLDVKDKIVLNKQKHSLDRSESRITPKSASLRTPVSKFLFDDQQVRTYIKAVSKLNRQKSISSDNVSSESPRKSGSEKLHSACSLNRLSKDSWSDEVFSRLNSFPLGPQLSPYIDFFESTPVKGFSRLSGSRFTSAGLLPELPELPSLTEECVYKYDVCLGYLLHSVQCDNKMICVYSLQRNKQLMESVITPLTASPQTPHKKPHEHGSANKNKAQLKTKLDDLPNPAAPITSVPSDRLVHAGFVLRTVLLARAPHMIRDRKFHLRTYRRCMVGTEMVDWLLQQSALVHSRTQAVGMWQALVEEGVIVHVCHEHQFKDKYLFYRFHEDDEGVSTVPSSATKRECEEDLPDVFLMLAHIGPDAMMRMILRKPPHERMSEDLEIIYEELLHIKALSHLSTMVKRELASVLLFESHAKSGTVLFNQGDEGKSWYIILKGSVNVVIYGKGVVCTLHEGDDFGKLALVNDAPRAATIVLRDDNCHFLRVDKEDFNRILRDVEANTVRLKEHGQDVLVLEKIPSNTQTADGTVQAHYKYSVMAGTPEKMLEHLLESRLDNKNETEIDGFLEDFLLTHVIFMPCNHLCPVLLSHYHSSSADNTEQEGFEFMLNHKKCVLHFVQEWANIVGVAFKEDQTINAFLEELHSCVQDDLQDYPSLKCDLAALETILNSHSGSPNGKLKKRASGTFSLSRRHSKDCFQDLPRKRKPISPSEEAIFKVYCADHTYSTLKLPMDTKVEQLLLSTKEKLGLGDDLILCEVKSTGERLIFKENDLCVTTGLSINGRLFVTPKEHLDALTPLPEQEGPTEGSFTTIEMFSSREMAYHMTLYDWELFTCVQEYELIYQVFGRYKFGKITANLDLFLRRFNEIQFWVVTEMVRTNNLSKRVSLLRKFIKLAAHCKEFKNLNSFFAIVMGLSNIAVSRLSQTWEKLPGKFKKMFEDFETLMDPSRNHRVYRLSVAKMSPPILPFMPLLMKDMTFTHEGNKTYFDGLVNFEKMHMIAQTLKTVRFCRSAHLDLEAPGTLKSSDTSQYIRSLKVIDNQRLLTQLSHKLEPRKT